MKFSYYDPSINSRSTFVAHLCVNILVEADYAQYILFSGREFHDLNSNAGLRDVYL